jgi:sigma-B regulation protein RsbU (phosphoserine phosphatase)
MPPRELEMVLRLQQRLFLQVLPRVPGWDFAACCQPAQTLSGDYCDLFEVGAGQVALAVGDVSGKGLGAAFVLAGLHALIRSRLPRKTGNLAELMQELNEYFVAFLPPEMFVTLFLGLLDTAAGTLRYVNAGHPYPLVLAPAVAEPTRLVEGGLLLGIMPEAAYEERQIALPPGGLLAVFSDGLTDVRNEAGEWFQEKRLLAALRDLQALPVATVQARLLATVEHFAGRWQPRDDRALALIRRQSR